LKFDAEIAIYLVIFILTPWTFQATKQLLTGNSNVRNELFTLSGDGRMILLKWMETLCWIMDWIVLAQN